MKNKTWIAAVILLLFVIVSAVCWISFKPETALGNKEITVEVIHKDTSVNTYTFQTKQKYLYGALYEQGLIGELTDGYFVELDGETADGNNEEWWGYTKSGEYMNYGVADCAIKNGDHYEFTFNVGW